MELDDHGSYRWQKLTHVSMHPLVDRLRVAGDGGLALFTSGSTGSPKAALHSVERFLHKFRDEKDRPLRTLAFLLFDHVGGLDTVLYTLTRGGTLVLTRRRDPAAVLALIASHQIELLPASPSFLRMLCAQESNERRDLSSLKIITYGSECMDALTLARLADRFPSVQLTQKYGTTETGSPRTISRQGDSLWLKIDSRDVETKIIDDILWLRCRGTALGYLNAPTLLQDEGWYCTGDWVEAEGEWIRILGRASDVINVGGRKVAPAEIEQTILELDFVRDVVASGQPHALTGQVVCVRVVLAAVDLAPKAAAKQIRLHCLRRLGSHKVPVRVDIVSGSLANDRQKHQRA